MEVTTTTLKEAAAMALDALEYHTALTGLLGPGSEAR